MIIAVLAIGLVCVVEGLVLALAPARLKDILMMLEKIPMEKQRLIGLAALAIGVVLIWFARSGFFIFTSI